MITLVYKDFESRNVYCKFECRKSVEKNRIVASVAGDWSSEYGRALVSILTDVTSLESDHIT